MSSWLNSALPIPFALLGVCVTGCSLMVELDSRQCATDTDCVKLASAGETFLCEKGFCQHPSCGGDTQDAADQSCRSMTFLSDTLAASFKTAICAPDETLGGEQTCQPAQCKVTTECSGAAGICDTSTNRCVRASDATCASGADAECAQYDALSLCVNRMCASSQCTQDADCRSASSSPTIACEKGKCVDHAWGCIGQADERPLMSATATYKIKFVSALNPSSPPDHVDVKLCGAVFDTGCTRAPGHTLHYDQDTGQLTVENLQQETRIHLLINAYDIDDAGNMLPYFETEFYSQRPVRDTTVADANIVLIPPAAVNVLAANTDMTVDTENYATVAFQIFNCEGKLAEGVSFSAEKTQSTAANGDPVLATLFYIREGNIPVENATVTTAYGSAGYTNLPSGQNTFTVRIGSTVATNFTIGALKNRVTVGHVYPGAFSE